MEKFVIELIIAIREIKEILNMHTEEIIMLKEAIEKTPAKSKNDSVVDERLIKLALEGSKNLYMQTLESKVEKKLKELEFAVKDISGKIGQDREIEVTENHLNRLRKALAE